MLLVSVVVSVELIGGVTFGAAKVSMTVFFFLAVSSVVPLCDLGMLGVFSAFYFLTFSSRTSLVMPLERGIVLNTCLFLFCQDEQTKQIFQMRPSYQGVICCIFLTLCLCRFSVCFNHLHLYWKATTFFSVMFTSSVFNSCKIYPWERAFHVLLVFLHCFSVL